MIDPPIPSVIAQGTRHDQAMADGRRLSICDWPVADARGAVLIVHGLGEHIGRYAHVAAWFNARGYEVRGYDQRGHGRSSGQHGGLHRPDDLLTDLAAVYTDYATDKPDAPLLFGHSMGGVVAARAVLDGRLAPSRLVLSSPAFRSHEKPAMIALAGVLAKALPNLPLRNGLAVQKISHDETVATAYQRDPLCRGWITPRLADFIFRAGQACIDDAPKLAVPTLLLAAGSDALVDPSGSRDFAAGAWATNRLTARYFDTLYHELFNEAEPARSQVFKQLGHWLNTTR